VTYKRQQGRKKKKERRKEEGKDEYRAKHGIIPIIPQLSVIPKRVKIE
jgi:hypothetical protein